MINMVEEIEEIEAKIEKTIKKQKARVEKVVIKKQAQAERKLIKKRLKKLKKLRGISIKTRKAEALRAEIARRKLLQAIISRQREGRPVNILRNIEDKIPNVFTKEPEKPKSSFLGKGGLI